MAEVLLDMAVSLDGLIAGPGGADAGLYDWYFNPTEVSRPVIEELVEATGAIVMGRGAYATGEEAGGWEDTPYAVPHFVITHHPPPQCRAGARSSSSSSPTALRPRSMPRRRQPATATRPSAAVPTLPDNASWLDSSMSCNCTSSHSSSEEGVRLFSGFDQPWRLTKTRVIDAPNVTHLRYRVDGSHR